MTPEILAAIEPLVAAFEALGVSYHVGGSVASSAFGVARSTLDVDIVADLSQEHASVLVRDLEGSYYVDAKLLQEAIRRERSFNLVHLETFKLEKLAEFAREQAVEAVLCTGDYTLWGTEHEYKAARRAIQPVVEAARSFVTVPGNHDVYTHSVVKAARFERHFGDFLESDAPEVAVDGLWPLVRWLGPEAVAIAVNSSVPHRVPWRSSGRISPVQLDALRRLFQDPRVRERFVFVMTHHALRLANGRPDSAHRRLENADAFLEVCSKIRRGAILFGHVHDCYRLTLPGLDIDLFNAGSATMFRSEGLWLFDVKSGKSGHEGVGGWGMVIVWKPLTSSLDRDACLPGEVRLSQAGAANGRSRLTRVSIAEATARRP